MVAVAGGGVHAGALSKIEAQRRSRGWHLEMAEKARRQRDRRPHAASVANHGSRRA